MTSPFVPVAFFVTLVVSVAAAVPLSDAGAGFALLSLVGFIASLGGLIWAVIRADRAADPQHVMTRAAERFEQRWPRFERDFWAHVAALEAAPQTD
jgi:hypothetical protein